MVEAAERDGCRIAAAGTHPFSRWEDQRLTPKDRYDSILQEFQQLTREQIIFGCHVHVGIADRDEAIRVMNRVRPWLAPILALSANSPFWLGVDTGYASYRTELFGRFPTAHIPHSLASRAEYDDLIAAMVSTGSIEDASKIYWDVRPSLHFDTLEFRVADVCQTIDEAVMVAGLCRALAVACLDAHYDEGSSPPVRPELLQSAKWRAARFGLDGDLIDLHDSKAVPARQMVKKVLAFLRPSLEALGQLDEIARLVDQTLTQGNGAMRQRAAFRKNGAMNDVVDQMIRGNGRRAEVTARPILESPCRPKASSLQSGPNDPIRAGMRTEGSRGCRPITDDGSPWSRLRRFVA